jgi:hypothetical protein
MRWWSPRTTNGSMRPCAARSGRARWRCWGWCYRRGGRRRPPLTPTPDPHRHGPQAAGKALVVWHSNQLGARVVQGLQSVQDVRAHLAAEHRVALQAPHPCPKWHIWV